MVSICVNPTQNPTILSKKIILFQPMLYPVQAANNGFLTQAFLLHYVIHSANSELVRRAELGPYSRLKHSKSHRSHSESPIWATKRLLKKKASSKSRSIWCQGIFFPIHP